MQFDPAAAAIGVAACDGLVSRLLAVQKATADVTGLSPFAGPHADFPSGTKLADEYSTLASELENILGTHITLLGDMADTFKAAARVFENAEADSAAAFEGLTISGTVGDSYSSRPSLDVPSSEQSINPVPVPGGAALVGLGPGSVVGQYTKPDDGRAVDPENPYSKKWRPLYDLGVSINHAAVTAVSAYWGWMATEIRAGVDEFKRTALGEGGQGSEYSIQSGWVGQSAEMARRAVQARVDDGAALADAATTVGSQLAGIADWLEKTKNAMPPLPDDPALPGNPQGYMLGGKETALAPLSTYQHACELYYCTGLVNYNAALVSLPVPSAQPVTTPQVRQTPRAPGTTTAESPSSTTPPVTTETPEPQTDSPVTTTQPQDTQQTTLEQQALAAAQQVAQTLLQQGTQVVQQGIQAAQQIAAQVAQTVQQGIEQTTKQVTGQDPAATLDPVTGLPVTAVDGKPSAGIPSGGGGSPTSPTSPSPELRTTSASLFPRAAAASDDAATTSTRAGLASGSGSPTTMGPMAPGAGAAGAGQGQGKQHQRAEYLNSAEYLTESWGEAPKVVKPVADS
ncbi:hypothetical protein [Nocardia otitidiscaviarum]|uniref:hypothetical protein n=1 Tax=Nocardia otitidiscaviarum TaxID=1823 RepID=UPI0018946E67|nr:hypothetical protein [Nocardia otitidiscaviarum]MBF6178434.1 hypothetical protein [Nocardia otitidiscaviarum]